SDLIRGHAEERPDKPAMIFEDRAIAYAELDAVIDRVAAALQREGLAKNDAVAILAMPSIEYACAFFGALRAGCVPTPLQPSATPAQL
ncbi:AMP-binding protein, partial [Klebsiella pneumoniae]